MSAQHTPVGYCNLNRLAEMGTDAITQRQIMRSDSPVYSAPIDIAPIKAELAAAKDHLSARMAQIETLIAQRDRLLAEIEDITTASDPAGYAKEVLDKFKAQS